MVTPRVGRSGTITLTPNGWLMWHPEPQRAALPLPPEWVFRAWSDVNLDDDASILAVLSLRGMVWGGIERVVDDETWPSGQALALPPVDSTFGVVNHIAVVREHLVTLRDLSQRWLDTAVRGADHVGLPDPFWRMLGKGLTSFTPVTLARDPNPLVDLYEAGCWQLYMAITDGATPKRCLGCGRVFYRKDGTSRRTVDVRYCTERCRGTARMRRYRARSQTRAGIDQ
jgi:hypothetical protein